MEIFITNDLEMNIEGIQYLIKRKAALEAEGLFILQILMVY